MLGLFYFICRTVVRARFGKVLVAIRDAESGRRSSATGSSATRWRSFPSRL